MKFKFFEMDRNNRSISLLRYLVIFKIHKDQLLTTELIKQIVHAGIYEYFLKNKKKKELKLISVYVYKNHVKINFQALPVFDLEKFIKDLYNYSKKYIFEKAPELGDNLWSENIFLGTRRQIVKQQVEAYLGIQKDIGAVDKSN